ncbi:hypothetical protein [Vaginisenegalia massiliensis]|uniref:hypothetical protein n=1 Tax=Vaginisenegalia massiliensis TaxID=2058294 RepID=UPI000F52361A|nr:hypothetical protein [Vaginisenegalia massiliensis]
MKKSTVRSTALGFLASGILTGAFAVFFQGNLPVQGTSLDSIVNQSQQSDKKVKELESKLALFSQDKTELEKKNSQLQASLEKLKDEKNSKKSKKDSSSNDSSDSSSSQDETLANNQSSQDENQTSQTSENVKSGTFVINDGEGSDVIAQRLVDEGYLNSTDEFLSIVDQWNLSSVLQTGSFELNSGMSAHDIASILTGGEYYYIP